jgi:hypothetical protein
VRAQARGGALISGLGVLATREGEWADQSGPALGGASNDRWGLGVERADVADICRSEPLDRGRTVAMRCTAFYSSVTDVSLSAEARSPETAQTQSPGGLGSPVRAGMGEEGLANSLAGLRPRERDRRQENGEGEVLQAGQATPARNPSPGKEVLGMLRPGLALVG